MGTPGLRPSGKAVAAATPSQPYVARVGVPRCEGAEILRVGQRVATSCIPTNVPTAPGRIPLSLVTGCDWLVVGQHDAVDRQPRNVEPFLRARLVVDCSKGTHLHAILAGADRFGETPDLSDDPYLWLLSQCN